MPSAPATRPAALSPGERQAHEVAAHAEEYYDEVSDMVRRHPAQALGIAAGVGFLLG